MRTSENLIAAGKVAFTILVILGVTWITFSQLYAAGGETTAARPRVWIYIAASGKYLCDPDVPIKETSPGYIICAKGEKRER